MPDEKNGGGGDKILPLRPSQDSQQPLSRKNLAAAAEAEKIREESVRNAPIRARILGLLTQETEIYTQIQNAKVRPSEAFWITTAPQGGAGIPKLQKFFQKVPREEIEVTVDTIQKWLHEKFGHETPTYPRVFPSDPKEAGGVSFSAFITWAPPPPSGRVPIDEEPLLPAE